METILLIHLVGAQVAGRLADVGVDDAGRPMWRRLRVVEMRRVRGEDWVYWTWEPEPCDDGRLDVGYSGMILTQARRQRRALRFVAADPR